MNEKYGIQSLSFVSLYFKEHAEAIAFYSKVLGPPDKVNEEESYTGWKLGDTWLTIFPSKIGTAPDSNPCNTEFAICVSTDEQVDALFAAFVEAGATGNWKPEDTWMYDPMRFSAVDDPFGVRIDIYCPHPK